MVVSGAPQVLEGTQQVRGVTDHDGGLQHRAASGPRGAEAALIEDGKLHVRVRSDLFPRCDGAQPRGARLNDEKEVASMELSERNLTVKGRGGAAGLVPKAPVGVVRRRVISVRRADGSLVTTGSKI